MRPGERNDKDGGYNGKLEEDGISVGTVATLNGEEGRRAKGEKTGVR